jgi:site-specific recombinase XerD
MNAYLQELADICGITKHISSHLARHTFATTVTLSNGVPLETVSKMLGHTKISTTQIYARIVDKTIGNEMDKLSAAFSGTKFGARA